MTLNDHRFAPHWIPTTVTTVLVVLFVGLGSWQLQRADLKQQLAQQLAAYNDRPNIMLDDPSIDWRKPESAVHRKVSLQGRFLSEKTLLLENRRLGSKLGVHVLTPFQLSSNSRIVLVNRGWLASDQLTSAIDPVGRHEITLSGRLVIPKAPLLDLSEPSDMLTTASTPSAIDQDAVDFSAAPRWPLIVLERYRQWSGIDVAPWLLLQSTEALPTQTEFQQPQSSQALPIQTQSLQAQPLHTQSSQEPPQQRKPDFVRQWPSPRIDHSMHIGYALQWFAFALIVTVIWVKLSLRKVPAAEDARSPKNEQEVK